VSTGLFMAVIEIIFWGSVFLVFYAYIGYPVVLFVLSSTVQMTRDLRFILSRDERRTQPHDDQAWPAVSLIIAAYNEEDVIREKIENTLQLDYPGSIEIIVASDGSSDRTNEIAGDYEARGVRLIAYGERRGKTSVINDTVGRAEHDIVVLSDANTMYDRGALRHLVKYFNDSSVAVVVGEMTLASASDAHKSETYYWHYEVMLKFMENKLGAILGANGGIYALRKELFEPVPPDTIVDDFVIPLKIREKGYRLVYSPEARGFEKTAQDIYAETVRRRRIAAGNFQAVVLLWRLLNPLRGYVSFSFFSHKILRWFAPFFMIGALAANAVLSTRPFYLVLLVLQVAFYASAYLGWRAAPGSALKKICAIPHYLVTMNLAMLRGFVNFLRGQQKVTWQKITR